MKFVAALCLLLAFTASASAWVVDGPQDDPFAVAMNAGHHATHEPGCPCCAQCACKDCPNAAKRLPVGEPVQYRQVCTPNGCRWVKVEQSVSHSAVVYPSTAATVSYGYGFSSVQDCAGGPIRPRGGLLARWRARRGR